jgi:hypothetical protein
MIVTRRRSSHSTPPRGCPQDETFGDRYFSANVEGGSTAEMEAADSAYARR